MALSGRHTANERSHLFLSHRKPMPVQRKNRTLMLKGFGCFYLLFLLFILNHILLSDISILILHGAVQGQITFQTGSTALRNQPWPDARERIQMEKHKM